MSRRVATWRPSLRVCQGDMGVQGHVKVFRRSSERAHAVDYNGVLLHSPASKTQPPNPPHSPLGSGKGEAGPRRKGGVKPHHKL